MTHREGPRVFRFRDGPPWAAVLGTMALACSHGAHLPLAAQEPQALSLAPADAAVEERFHSILSVRELSDGRLLLTESGTRLLAVVDWRTGEVATIGRRGEGPREYRRPFRLHALHGDSTLLLDSGLNRSTVLEGATIVETIGADDPVNREIPFGGILGFDNGGRLVAVKAHAWDESLGPVGRLGPDTLVLLRVDGTTARSDTLARVNGSGSWAICMQEQGFPGGCSPVVTAEQGVVFADGWLALARVEPYRVDWRQPDGRWRRGPPLPFVPPQLDRPERCAAVQGWTFRGIRERCEADELVNLDWPAELPPFLARTSRARTRMSAPDTPTLFAAPDGTLLIRRIPSLARMETRYDLVDRSGTLVGILRLPLNEAIVGFGESHVYVIETDPFDLQRLRRHPWP